MKQVLTIFVLLSATTVWATSGPPLGVYSSAKEEDPRITLTLKANGVAELRMEIRHGHQASTRNANWSSSGTNVTVTYNATPPFKDDPVYKTDASVSDTLTFSEHQSLDVLGFLNDNAPGLTPMNPAYNSWIRGPLWQEPHTFKEDDSDQLNCARPDTTLEINTCLEADLKSEDDALNAAYKAALNRSDKDGKALLRKAQRAWIAFRDANCDIAYDAAKGGSMRGQLYLDCKIRMTQDRTSELNKLNAEQD